MSYGSKDWREWVLDEEAGLPFIKSALDHGINFFDTADIYSVGISEEILGRALKRYSSRDRVVIATKCGGSMSDDPADSGLSRRHILSSVENSLRRLGTDYIDLYQIHRLDYETPFEETMGALDEVVRAGKVRFIGASSMFAWQLATMQHIAADNGWARFISVQPQYNLLYREEEREMLPYCVETNLGVIPWSPIARGFLAGNRNRNGGQTARADRDDLAKSAFGSDSDFQIADVVAEIAARRGVSSAQIALAWVLSKPAVTAPIIGATKAHHIPEAVAALAIELDPDEVVALESAYRPRLPFDHGPQFPFRKLGGTLAQLRS
jgi:aryl-alcohol dehydrogenase (NADP+)